MVFKVADRVREVTTSTGTGAVELTGPATAFQSFNVAIGDGNDTYYVIAHQAENEFEVGIGTYTHGTLTLSRDTVISSSNAGALVSFSAGTKDVFVSHPASRAGDGGQLIEETAQTTDATPTTVILTETLDDETAYHMRANVLAFSDVGEAWDYELLGAFKRTAGTLSQLSAPGDVDCIGEDVSPASIIRLIVSSNTIACRVTGQASRTINWKITASLLRVS